MGTLDPQAKGVLLIGVGRGTKMAPFLLELPKTYRAMMVLGIKTDTQDAWGKIISQKDDFRVSKEELLQVFSKFTGEIEQIPPIFSALKYHGKPLYSYARKGISLEIKPRKVNIKELRFLEYKDNRVDFEIYCSKGTYIRTLCNDIGERLGCGAHLARLERTRVGEFRIEEALTLKELERASAQGELDRYLHPIEPLDLRN
ncbi:MAG: tRNA pseudouridine(55) synthase TruB [Nitrospinae bacterium RIFCSPLOWO2_12_FULL_45_22]|nr:MAG: tRNA pseudouridine(55) synthase TruB [Nitrospinae bacterium RIFCSPLOWO2_12_FULL_45_22]